MIPLFSHLKDIRRFTVENLRPLLLLSLCVLLATGFLFFFYRLPAASMGPEQPIAFSHRVHAGVKQIHCLFCHPYAGRSIDPGIPPVEKCLFCHNYIIANHPEIRKEHMYFNTNTPTPWRKVFYLPEHVLFNHERHIRKDIACAECHGRVESMDRLKSVRFRMEFCITCHGARKANVDCWLACHS